MSDQLAVNIIKSQARYMKYYNSHKDEINKKKRDKYNENPEKANLRNKIKIMCECGVEITRGILSRHIKTKKHINRINPPSIIDTNEILKDIENKIDVENPPDIANELKEILRNEILEVILEKEDEMKVLKIMSYLPDNIADDNDPEEIQKNINLINIKKQDVKNTEYKMIIVDGMRVYTKDNHM